MKRFKYPHFVHEKSKTVYVYVESGWPTVMMLPKWIKTYFPEGYRGSLCTLNFLESLKKNEQEKSN